MKKSDLYDLLARIVSLVNEHGSITLEADMGGNTLTVCVGGSHTHCGVPDGDLENLLASLHSTLTGGPGLSWAPETPNGITERP